MIFFYNSLRFYQCIRNFVVFNKFNIGGVGGPQARMPMAMSVIITLIINATKHSKYFNKINHASINQRYGRPPK
jgi:hypothetical protein